MRRFGVKLALAAVVVCALSGCVSKMGPGSFSPTAGGDELPFMPKGLFCDPDGERPTADEAMTDEATAAEETCSSAPAKAPCRACPPRLWLGHGAAGMVEPVPLVDAREKRSQFHPVPTRPVFMPQPYRGMMAVPYADPLGPPPREDDAIVTPPIEMIPSGQPPSAQPPTPPLAAGQGTRLASVPSWIFRTSANQSRSESELSVATDSKEIPLRR